MSECPLLSAWGGEVEPGGGGGVRRDLWHLDVCKMESATCPLLRFQVLMLRSSLLLAAEEVSMGLQLTLVTCNTPFQHPAHTQST